MSFTDLRRALLRSLATQVRTPADPASLERPREPGSAAERLSTLLDDAGILTHRPLDHGAESLGVVDELLALHRDHDVELPRSVRDVVTAYVAETMRRLGLEAELERRGDHLEDVLSGSGATLGELHAHCAG